MAGQKMMLSEKWEFGMVVATALGFALTIGTGLTIAVTVPLYGKSEWGPLGIVMWLVCFWGSSPGFVLPFVYLAVRRRPATSSILYSGVFAGIAFPAFLALSVVYLVPGFYEAIGMQNLAHNYMGELDYDDLDFWLGLAPFLIAVGYFVAALVIRRPRPSSQTSD